VLAGKTEKAWELKFENLSIFVLISRSVDFADDSSFLVQTVKSFLCKFEFSRHGVLLDIERRLWVWSSVLYARVSVLSKPEGALKGVQHDLLSWLQFRFSLSVAHLPLRLGCSGTNGLPKLLEIQFCFTRLLFCV
jgi:hypothetical protein